MLGLTTAPRGLTHFPNMRMHLLQSALIVIAFAAFVFLQEGAVLSAWATLYQWLSAAAGLPGEVTLSGCSMTNIMCHAPTAVQGAALPVQTQARTLVGIAVAAALLLSSFCVNPLKVPLRYGLRIFATFIGVPALLLLVIPQEFTASAPAHLGQVLQTGYLFLLFMPLVLGLTGFIFPGALVKKAGVVLVAMAYFFVLVPVLTVLHLVLLHALGLAFLPFLNVFGTTLLFSFELMAFYGVLAAQD